MDNSLKIGAQQEYFLFIINEKIIKTTETVVNFKTPYHDTEGKLQKRAMSV